MPGIDLPACVCMCMCVHVFVCLPCLFARLCICKRIRIAEFQKHFSVETIEFPPSVSFSSKAAPVVLNSIYLSIRILLCISQAFCVASFTTFTPAFT